MASAGAPTKESDVGKAESPTMTSDGEGLRDRALTSVVANLSIAPFFLVPFTLLIGAVLRAEIDVSRFAGWALVATLSSTLIALSVSAHRNGSGPTSAALVFALRASLFSMGVVFGLTTWVTTSESVELITILSIFPISASGIAAMLTAGRRDMYLSMLLPMALGSMLTLATANDDRLRGMSFAWIFYVIAVSVIHRTLSKTALTALELQHTSDRLLATVERDQVMLTATNAQLATSIEQLTHQATHDALTGLLNRRGMFEALEGLIHAPADRRPAGVLFLDLDRFKAINDTLGHRGGDHFLRIVADRISRCIAAHGFAGRIGGDEFVVALPGADEQMGRDIADQLKTALGQAVLAAGREIPSSVSIGVAHAPTHGASVSEVLANANLALYRAKGSGRNRVVAFDADLARENLGRSELEMRLRRAIDDGDIVPYFQPELDASTGKIVGAELLARWVQPNGSVIAAQEFMEIAGQAGLLERVTERVLGGARKQIRRLAMLGLPEDFRFRVNLAPHSTERPWLDNPIDALVDGIDPRLLTVDVRESFVNVDLAAAAANLAEFRARGGRVCLDDFAQGVSSLSMLRRLPLDEVRIDRISIDTIASHPHDRAIVRSIIALTREIGLEVTADGVETGAQADALIALGCIRQQGHLYAPALAVEEFEDYLLHRLADQYVRAAENEPTWSTSHLSDD
jgi:diguanylate cyclase (GGDEF)-like protein